MEKLKDNGKHIIKKESGQIVVISSVIGKFGTPLRTSYAGSKHALQGFFDSLRAEIHDKNIAVTIICPGYVSTEVSNNALTADGTKYNINDKGNANGMSTEVYETDYDTGKLIDPLEPYFRIIP